MKAQNNNAVLALAVCFAALLLAGCATTRIDSDTGNERIEETAIRKRLAEVFDAAQRKDLERLDSYHAYGPKFTKFSGASPSRQDAETSRKGEHGLAALSDVKMDAEDLKVDVFGKVGIATFALHFAAKRGQTTIQQRERGTLVLVKERGEWKITHEHFSPIIASP